MFWGRLVFIQIFWNNPQVLHVSILKGKSLFRHVQVPSTKQKREEKQTWSWIYQSGSEKEVWEAQMLLLIQGKRLRLMNTLPICICPFNQGCSSRYNCFLLINFSLFLFYKTIMCTLPTVWQLYRCKVINTAVHCTGNLFMIWHRRSAMSMTTVQHLGALN